MHRVACLEGCEVVRILREQNEVLTHGKGHVHFIGFSGNPSLSRGHNLVARRAQQKNQPFVMSAVIDINPKTQEE